ncbi:MAG: RluA family pseudouridine synthase [Treponema sp.]|jgi:23S rRNA pseudouridine955/2504/2580 synthase|nr:RluA family pseudouridine synthase [Treponema sp.]
MPLLQAGNDDDGRRLDRILRKALPGVPLSALHRLLRKGRILVDGRPAGPGDRVSSGAVIDIPGAAIAAGKERRLPSPEGETGAEGDDAFPPGTPSPSALLPAAGILAEGRSLLILNKPAGMTVHGPESLNTRVQSYLENTRSPSLSFRPGPLHRLDKPSSGIIVFSKNLAGARRFSALLRERRLRKYYLALAEGSVEGPERWEDTLTGKDAGGFPAGRCAGGVFAGSAAGGPEITGRAAITAVRPLARSGREENHTLLLAEIETGRTHQIRIQAALRGHPLAGDRKYGGGGRGFFLHAWALDIPVEELAALGLDNDEQGRNRNKTDGTGRYLRIIAPPPGSFRRRIRDLFGENMLRHIDKPSHIISFNDIMNQDVPGFFSQS